MTDSKAIVVEGLCKTYGKSLTPAVDHVSFSVEKGTVFGLLGPNGAGKTTTIGILCGLLKQSAGDVSIFGLNHRTHDEEIKKIIGVVPQEIALFQNLTAFENLRYFGSLQGMRGAALKKRVLDLLDVFSLADVAHKQVETYSGGMKRIVNLVAGILHNPSILFLDEPTAGVDAHIRKAIMEHLKELCASGMTIFYTSHLLQEAQELCTDVLVLEQGKVLVQGKPMELANRHGLNSLEEFYLHVTSSKSHGHP